MFSSGRRPACHRWAGPGCFAAHGSYATHATFINGFKPAEWAAAGASAIGVIAAALAPAKSPRADRLTPAPQPAPARQPA